MTITPIQIAPAQYLTTTIASYYTSTNIKTRIDKATFTNTDSVPHNVSVYLVPNGASPSAANLVVARRPVANATTYNAPELVGHILASGDSLQAVTDANSQVVFAAAGVTISP